MSILSQLAKAGKNVLHFFGFLSEEAQSSEVEGKSSTTTRMSRVEKVMSFHKIVNMDKFKSLVVPKRLDRECRRFFSRSYWQSANDTHKDTMRIVTLLAREVSVENIQKILNLPVIRIMKWKGIYERKGPMGGIGGVKFEINRS